MPAIYPAFEDPSLTDIEFNGRSLSSNLEKLDEIAISVHVRTLAEMIDARTMMLMILDEDQLPANCPPLRWYPAQEGLATVQGLVSYLEQNPEKLSASRDAIQIDLQNLGVLLEKARDQNIRFHLLVDM